MQWYVSIVGLCNWNTFKYPEDGVRDNMFLKQRAGPYTTYLQAACIKNIHKNKHATKLTVMSHLHFSVVRVLHGTPDALSLSNNRSSVAVRFHRMKLLNITNKNKRVKVYGRRREDVFTGYKIIYKRGMLASSVLICEENHKPVDLK